MAKKSAKPAAPKAQPAAKKAAPKKAAPKKAKPSAEVEPQAETKAKPAPKPRKVEGLRKPQVRILQALAKSKSPLSRSELGTKAGVDVAFCTEYVGSSNPDIRAKNDQKVCVSLLTLGYVTEEKHEDSRAVVYSITPAGRKALEVTPSK